MPYILGASNYHMKITSILLVWNSLYTRNRFLHQTLSFLPNQTEAMSLSDLFKKKLTCLIGQQHTLMILFGKPAAITAEVNSNRTSETMSRI